jgi:hypothetical protein
VGKCKGEKVQRWESAKVGKCKGEKVQRWESAKVGKCKGEKVQKWESYSLKLRIPSSRKSIYLRGSGLKPIALVRGSPLRSTII